MRLLRGFDADGAADFRGSVVSIGNFDGVHRGHRAIAETLVRRARESDRPAMVLTFDPHPIRLLRPEAEPPSLSTIERKVELLGSVGVDFVVAYPTDRDLLELSPTAFFESIIRERIDAAGLVEGPNFFFGKGRAGNVETLRDLCAAAGLSFEVVSPIVANGDVVSSSRIRGLIAEGRVRQAADLLGHPYRLTGVVGRGAGRGRELGTPTANLASIPTLLPAHGVYVGLARLDPHDERTHPAAVNIGPNPTFGEDATKVEAHLVGYSGDLYDRPLHVDLLDRLRDVRTFAGVPELEAQIAEDIRRTVEVAATAS